MPATVSKLARSPTTIAERQSGGGSRRYEIEYDSGSESSSHDSGCMAGPWACWPARAGLPRDLQTQPPCSTDSWPRSRQAGGLARDVLRRAGFYTTSPPYRLPPQQAQAIWGADLRHGPLRPGRRRLPTGDRGDAAIGSPPGRPGRVSRAPAGICGMPSFNPLCSLYLAWAFRSGATCGGQRCVVRALDSFGRGRFTSCPRRPDRPPRHGEGNHLSRATRDDGRFSAGMDILHSAFAIVTFSPGPPRQ